MTDPHQPEPAPDRPRRGAVVRHESGVVVHVGLEDTSTLDLTDPPAVTVDGELTPGRPTLGTFGSGRDAPAGSSIRRNGEDTEYVGHEDPHEVGDAVVIALSPEVRPTEGGR